MEQREIMLHAIKELQQQQQEISMQILRALQTQEFESAESAENNTTAETVPNEVRTTRTTSKRMNESFQIKKNAANYGKIAVSARILSRS